jgi:hypothetical protein
MLGLRQRIPDSSSAPRCRHRALPARPCAAAAHLPAAAAGAMLAAAARATAPLAPGQPQHPSTTRWRRQTGGRRAAAAASGAPPQQLSDPEPKAKLAVFVSGGGSNFKAIHAACLDGRINAEVVVRLGPSPRVRGCDAHGRSPSCRATPPRSKPVRSSLALSYGCGGSCHPKPWPPPPLPAGFRALRAPLRSSTWRPRSHRARIAPPPTP